MKTVLRESSSRSETLKVVLASWIWRGKVDQAGSTPVRHAIRVAVGVIRTVFVNRGTLTISATRYLYGDRHGSRTWLSGSKNRRFFADLVILGARLGEDRGTKVRWTVRGRRSKRYCTVDSLGRGSHTGKQDRDTLVSERRTRGTRADTATAKEATHPSP